MIKNILRKFSLRTAEKELKSYLNDLNKGNDEQVAIILGHSALIYSQIIKKLPIIEEVTKEKNDVYVKELSSLVLQTGSLLKDYHSDGDIHNAAGVKLWNETFRCLCYTELNEYGIKMWSRLNSVSSLAKNYLTTLKQDFELKNNDTMVSKISEALEYVDLVPERYLK